MTWKQHLPQQAWSVSHRSLLVVICFRPHITRFGACELETLSLRDKPDADIVERRRPQRPSKIAAWMWIFILLENRDAVTRERERATLPEGQELYYFMFLLQHAHRGLLCWYCDVVGRHIEKIKSVLHSSLQALPYDILLDMVSRNAFFQGDLHWVLTMKVKLSQPRYSCPLRPGILLWS